MCRSLAADDLIILPQKWFFVKHFFWEAFELFWTWSASGFSVSAGTFQRLLVLFKGFLLRLQKSFFCLSAWRSSIIPHTGALVNTFWHLFSNFFARGVGSKTPTEMNPLRHRCAPERVQPYIITLYRQSKSQPGIDGGWYYPPESKSLCQVFPCKILSRKISTIFGDCYKTQNIVVFCLTCH